MQPNLREVCAALGWGAVSSIGLVAGALAGSFSPLSHHATALAMSMGAGLLLATASLQLAAEALRISGPATAVVSLLLGAGVFSAANAMLARFGATHRKRCGECMAQPTEAQQPGSGIAIALGTSLDAVPEALVLGLALRERALPLGLLIAISVGNLPEALSGAAGMRGAGRGIRYVLGLWSAIAIGTAVCTASAFATLGGLQGHAWPSRLQAFGAGALLAMTAETMIPEAFHNSPRFSGLLAGVGFCVLLLVDAVAR
jgi:ZIP family zinc transporter